MEKNTKITSEGIEIEIDGWKYFMYHSDKTHLYDLSSGKKRRVNLSFHREDSELKKIYFLLKKAITTTREQQ